MNPTRSPESDAALRQRLLSEETRLSLVDRKRIEIGIGAELDVHATRYGLRRQMIHPIAPSSLGTPDEVTTSSEYERGVHECDAAYREVIANRLQMIARGVKHNGFPRLDGTQMSWTDYLSELARRLRCGEGAFVNPIVTSTPEPGA
jgi:hypothetical protein